MSEQEPRELTTKQAANRAGVSIEYIRRMAKQGRIRARQPDGWTWFIDAADLGRWMAERTARHETRAE